MKRVVLKDALCGQADKELQDCPGTIEGLKRRVCHAFSWSVSQAESVMLSTSGRPLVDDQDVLLLAEGQNIVCIMKPPIPPKRVKMAHADPDSDPLEDEVNSLFSLQPQVPLWVRTVVHRCRIPEWMVALLLGIKIKYWLVLALWILSCRLASDHDLGPVFLLGTLFALIFTNLGTRTSEWSAYSIFNRGARRLGGQLTAEDLDAQMRRQAF